VRNHLNIEPMNNILIHVKLALQSWHNSPKLFQQTLLEIFCIVGKLLGFVGYYIKNYSITKGIVSTSQPA